MDTQVSVSLRELLEAGAHFGHQKARWNPKMRPYIFGQRGGVFIIDLQKTVVMFQQALSFVQNMAAQGKTILFVGTKRQAQEIVAREAERCEMHYVHQRWLGGMLTNWQTVKKSVEKMRELENIETDKRFAHLKKKERLSLQKDHDRLHHVLAGVRDMTRRPDVLFVIDAQREHIAVAEARKLDIPIVGVVDTNSDPTVLDFPVPANDDAIRSIELFTRLVADAVIEGRNQWKATRTERAGRSGGTPRRRPGGEKRQTRASKGEEPAAETAEAAAAASAAQEAETSKEPETAPAPKPAPDTAGAPAEDTTKGDATAE